MTTSAFRRLQGLVRPPGRPAAAVPGCGAHSGDHCGVRCGSLAMPGFAFKLLDKISFFFFWGVGGYIIYINNLIAQ